MTSRAPAKITSIRSGGLEVSVELFLDNWYELAPETYNTYWKINDSATIMVQSLKKDQRGLYTQILQFSINPAWRARIRAQIKSQGIQ